MLKIKSVRSGPFMIYPHSTQSKNQTHCLHNTTLKKISLLCPLFIFTSLFTLLFYFLVSLSLWVCLGFDFDFPLSNARAIQEFSLFCYLTIWLRLRHLWRTTFCLRAWSLIYRRFFSAGRLAKEEETNPRMLMTPPNNPLLLLLLLKL